MASRNLYYIANARMPTERAHGIQIAKMCEWFVRNGINLTLIVPRRGSGEDLESFYELSVPIKVVRLPVISTYTRGKLGFWLGSLSFLISYFFYMRWQRIRRAKGSAYTIDMDQFSILAMPLIGFPYSIEIHDSKPYGLIFAFVFRFARGIITINDIIKKKIMSRFSLAEDQVLVYPNGIDMSIFKPMDKNTSRRALKLPLDRKIVMYTGQFYDWKGLEIFAEVAPLLGDIDLYLIGGSREEYAKVTGPSVLPQNLFFVNKQPYTSIPVWLSAADALVVLGTKKNEYSYYHTSPMKLFEYLAAERPIIASFTPALAEIVSDKEVIFYAPDSATDLASKIAVAMKARQPTVSAEKNQRYSWDARANSIIKFIVSRRSS